MRCWCGYLSGARCKLFAYGPTDVTAISKPPLSLASYKSRLVVPFWYWLAEVFLQKRLLNGCSSSSSSSICLRFFQCFDTYDWMTERTPTLENSVLVYQKILSQNKWRNETDWEPAIPGLPENGHLNNCGGIC